MDMEPELVVGRLPVYGGDAEALDALLLRIRDHDLQSDKTYRDTVLLPAALLGIGGTSTAFGGIYEEHSDGAGIQATIYRDLDSRFQDRALRLFEGEGLLPSPYPRDLDLSRDELVERWNHGAGMVIWTGHGWMDSVHRVIWSADHDEDGVGDDDETSSPAFLESSDAPDLASAGGAFTWQMSCDNAWPEDAGNIATALLSGGAAGTVAATRVSYGSTPDFGETWEPRPELAGGTTAAYFYALLLSEGVTAGEALAWTKWALPGDGWLEVYDWVDCTGFAWATRALFNLYGDPTRSLELCEQDGDCDDGNPCTGSERCDQGFCVHEDVPDCSQLDSDCAVGLCDPDAGACVAEPLRDGASCDDGAWCTEDDSCSAGTCAGSERDCGSRDGWLAYCDEASESCQWTPLDSGDTGAALDGAGAGGCGCAAQGRARGMGALLLLLAGAFSGRRRRMVPD